MTDTGGRGGPEGDAGGPHAGTPRAGGPRCTCPAPELGHKCKEREQTRSTSAGGNACHHGLVDATTSQCLRCGHGDERLLRAMAAMLAWENTHAIWDMEERSEEPTPEQDYAMYRDKLLEVGRKAMEGK